MVSNSIKRTVNLAADYSRWLSSAVIGASPFIAGSENFRDILVSGMVLYTASYIAQVATGRVIPNGADTFSNRDNYVVHTVGRDAVTAFGSFFMTPALSSKSLEVLSSPECLASLSSVILLAGASEFFSKKYLRRLENELSHSILSSSDTLLTL